MSLHTAPGDLLGMLVSKRGSKGLWSVETALAMRCRDASASVCDAASKNFRECLFVKSFLCIEAVVERFTFRNHAHFRPGSDSKIIDR